MKTKKMLFKAAVCLMAVVIMMFSTVSALAAVDYTTTTVYTLGSEDVTVKTTVTGVTAGEISYLVHTGAEPTDETILHIDQITHGTTDTFSFGTTKTALTDTHSVLVGTQEAGKVEPTDALAKGTTTYTLTVNVENGTVAISDKADAENVVNVETTGTEVLVGNDNDLVIATTPATGYENGTVTVTLAVGDGEAAVVEGTELGKLTGDAVLTIAYAEAETKTEIVVDPEGAANDAVISTTQTADDDTEVPVKAYTRFGKIANPAGLKEYGIIVIYDEADALADIAGNMVIDGQYVDVLKGGNVADVEVSGLFAIVIEGLESEFVSDLYVRTYAIDAEDVVTYGAIQKYGIDGTVSVVE